VNRAEAAAETGTGTLRRSEPIIERPVSTGSRVESAPKPQVKAKERRAQAQAQSREQKHGDPGFEEPASEGYARYRAKQAERTGGKDATRSGHDAKKPGEGDRSKRQLDEDYE
jgi:hypothetical protein